MTRNKSSSKNYFRIGIFKTFSRSLDVPEYTDCPYCRGFFRENDSVRACPSCKVVLHTECASRTYGVCTSIGCKSKLIVRPRKAHIVVSGSNANEVEKVARSMPQQSQKASDKPERDQQEGTQTEYSDYSISEKAIIRIRGGKMPMQMISVYLTVQGGKQKKLDIPNDMSVREIISEITAKLKLPATGPNGLPLPYELFSKELARKLKSDETIEIAGVRNNDSIELIAKNVPGCFPKSSRVLLPSGEVKEIGELESGDQVLAYCNEFGGGSYHICKIEGIYRQTYSENICFNSKLITTPDQTILMSNLDWKIANEIVKGDELLQFPYRKTKIESIKRNKEVMTMLSITLPQPYCFVVEDFIVRDFIGKQKKVPKKIDAFVSYTEMDKDKALKVFELLEKNGFSTFLAEKSIKPGEIWEETTKESLRNCVNFLLLVTPNSLASEWVVSEWSAAWALDKKIIPILFRCGPEDLPRRLQSHQSVDFHDLEKVLPELQKSS